MPDFKIGLIGLDTSHASAFTKLLNDSGQEYHVPGARVTHAFSGGSADFALSRDRVAGFANEIRTHYGVEILDSPAAVAQACDAILITSADGRVHLEQFRETVPFRRPTFVDKPFATRFVDARAMADLAREHQIPLFSCSSLRFAVPFVEALQAMGKENVVGADFCGPMNLEPTQPGLFWYGIHAVEMLYATLGRGCLRLSAASNDDHDLVVGEWSDGRIGTVRGNRAGNSTFGALLHGAQNTSYVNAYAHPKPGYAGLLENVMTLLQTGRAPVELEETLEIVRFIEAANESRQNGQIVAL